MLFVTLNFRDLDLTNIYLDIMNRMVRISLTICNAIEDFKE